MTSSVCLARQRDDNLAFADTRPAIAFADHFARAWPGGPACDRIRAREGAVSAGEHRLGLIGDRGRGPLL